MSMEESSEEFWPSIAAVENVAVAKVVLKALRSSSSANRHYKQNAVHDDIIVENIEQFNCIVAEKSAAYTQAQQTEEVINAAITKYQPPVRYIASDSNHGNMLYNSSSTALLKSREVDSKLNGFSSDEDDYKYVSQNKSPTKRNISPNKNNSPGSKYDEESNDFDNNSDDDDEQQQKQWKKNEFDSDEDDKYNGRNTKANNCYQQGISAKSSSKGLYHKKSSLSADNFSGGVAHLEDDEDDNAELFMNFVAPNSKQRESIKPSAISATNSASSVNNNQSNKSNITTKLNTIVNGKSNTVYNNITGKTSNVNSSSSTTSGGNGGIRGIQDLLLSSGTTNINNSYTGTTTGIASKDLLKSVKPGQAIRVKPVSKLRSNSLMSNTGPPAANSTFGK